MRRGPDIRLDIMIKREEDYYLAHCLQFDVVVTDDTLDGAKAGILEACAAHIAFSIKHDNSDYLFHPAPPESWAEYLKLMKHPACSTETGILDIPPAPGADEEPSKMPAFIIQEIMCNDPASGRAPI